MPASRCSACGLGFTGLGPFDAHQSWTKIKGAMFLECIDPATTPGWRHTVRGWTNNEPMTDPPWPNT